MKILFICTAFAPENEIGCIRTTKLAKYLVRNGHEVTVISPTITEGMNVSDDLMSEEIKNLNHIYVSYSKAFYSLLYRKRNSLTASGKKTQMRRQRAGLKKVIYRLAEDMYTDIRNEDWYLQVRRILEKIPDRFDLVFSSYPSISSHWAACFARKKGIAECWIADFRDPLVLESSTGAARMKQVKRQSHIVHEADAVTHVSRAGVESFICKPEDHHKVKWIPNGYDEDDFEYVGAAPEYQKSQADQCLLFSYAGGLYAGERDCSPLFKAIRELIDEGKIKSDYIRFHYAGRDFGILKSQAEKYHVEEILDDRGLIPRKDALAMQAQSDCVVVATFCYQDHGGAMTGKIYEPIMMRKPILLLVSGPGKESEPGEFVNYLNAGTVYEQSTMSEDVSSVKKMILTMLEEKRRDGVVKSGIDEERRGRFEYSTIAQNLLECVTAKHN